MVRDAQILSGEPDACVCYCHSDQDIDYFHHQEVPSWPFPVHTHHMLSSLR